MLRTTVRDCLYLNWAFPAEALPPPPAPLRYQRHVWQGREHVFASALHTQGPPLTAAEGRGKWSRALAAGWWVISRTPGATHPGISMRRKSTEGIPSSSST